MTPVLLGRTPEHRDAIRSANGAYPHLDTARDLALLVLAVVLLAALLFIAFC